MHKKRHNCTQEEKVSILKRHLIGRVPISDLCDEYQLQPSVLYDWQKLFFENGAAAFARTPNSQKSADASRIEQLEEKLQRTEEKLQRKHEVLSELVEEHVKCPHLRRLVALTQSATTY